MSKSIFRLSKTTTDDSVFKIIDGSGDPYIKLKGSKIINMRTLEVMDIPESIDIGIIYLTDYMLMEIYGLSEIQLGEWIHHAKKVASKKVLEKTKEAM